MPSNIYDLSEWRNTIAIARVYAYIDTIECFARSRFSIELKNALRAATGRKVWDEYDGFGWTLFVNGPTRDAIDVLERHFRERDCVSAVHVAIELDAINGATRDDLVQLIDYHFHVRHSRATDRMFTPPEHPTQYSVDTMLRRQRGQRKASKIGVAYHDRPGKLDGELDKPRYEIRIETTRANRTMGFHTPKDLPTLMPVEFLAKVLVIKQHRPMLERIIRRSIRLHRQHPMMPTEATIRAKVRRDQVDTLTGFARAFPRQFERLKRWDCIDIVDALQFTPMVRDGKHVIDKVGEMSHVSQAPSPTLDQQVGHSMLPPRRKRHRKRLIIRERL